MEEQKKFSCGILTFETYLGKRKDWAGSSRIRGSWLAKYWEGAELFKQGRQYDVVIYQKAYWVEHAKQFKGIKILDICDPDWYHWSYQVVEMIQDVDAITTSTEELARSISKFTDKPVVCIPDRMDLEFHKGRKFHTGKAKWAVWFGYSTGFEMLKPALHFLKKNNLGLIVISDTNFILPSSYFDSVELRNLPWKLETVNDDILLGDMVLNPQGKNGKWKYKSNNKTLSAWALGMPVAHTVEEMNKFMDEEERQKESKLRIQEVSEKWEIHRSIDEYKELIEKIKESKK